MKFLPAMVVGTPGATDAFDRESEFDLTGNGPELAMRLLVRHCSGDWGTVSDEDKALNDQALVEGDRVMSAYKLEYTQTVVWVITEWDRSLTTFLLPDEY